MDLLQRSLAGGLLILAAAGFRAAALRRMPKGVFLSLWWVAAARLLLPLEAQSRFSVYTLLQALRPEPEAFAPVLPAPVTGGIPVQILPPVTPAETVPAAAPFPVKTAVWLTVAALLALWFLGNYVRWRRRFRESLPVKHPNVACWQAERPWIQVRVSDQISAPLTYGLRHPVILLPKGMDLSDKDALRCILTHEEVHIRRLDGLLKLALTAALCVHWFNPAAWLMYALANRDMELRCDEAVLAALGRDSRELYAMTLIQMAENRHMPLCSFSRKNGMEERILSIMNFKKKSVLTWILALVLAACITTVFATSAMTAGKTVSAPPDGPDAQFYADSSAETAAAWDEVLAPYVPFGLTYVFDDPDLDGNGLKMYFEGREVRGIFDNKSGVWITEHTGNGTYGKDAAELYAVYDENGLTGLRFATEEEQFEWAERREASSDMAALEMLRESVRFETDVCSFTVPEREGDWNIWISGRIVTADGMGVSVRYLEAESEKGEWIPGKTYSFEETSRKVDELIMEASFGSATASFDLLLDTAGLDPVFGAENPPELPASKNSVPEGMSMVWPVDDDWKLAATWFNPRAEDPDDRAHNGVDIAGMEAGSPIYAAAAGTVKEAGFQAKNGNYVRLDHGNGLETFYAHCQSLQVKTGDAVTLGQTIATVGSSGLSTGPHLHFEILLNGEQQDPLAYYQAGEASYAAWAERTAAKEPLSMEAKEALEKRLILWAEETLVDGEYPRNKNGQTYAPNEALTSLVGAPPDLIGAKATNGRYGYVSREELAEHGHRDHLAWGTLERVSDTEAVEPYSLPVYDAEGEVIGEFIIEAGGTNTTSRSAG